jgi:hypothetical protein
MTLAVLIGARLLIAPFRQQLALPKKRRALAAVNLF